MLDAENKTYICCPWCGEDDFDLPGLKHHVIAGYCDEYEACELVGLFKDDVPAESAEHPTA